VTGATVRSAVLGAAVGWGLLAPEAALRRSTEVAVLVLLGLSMTVTTGWLRTLGLHAPASAATGAVATTLTLGAGQALPVALVLGVVAGASTAALPVVACGRRRDLVPVATLVTTGAVWGLLLPTLRLSPFLRPVFLGIDLGGGRTLYLVAAVLAGAAWSAVANLGRSPVGRRARAVGVDPGWAAATGARSRQTWLGMFALSGALAGAGGCLLAVLAQGIPDPAAGSPAQALVVLAVALLGGAAVAGGAVAGALALGLAPLLLPRVPDAQVVLAALVLLVVGCVPAARGGLAGLGRRAAATSASRRRRVPAEGTP
jgi:ABC-type branched-subunit amino acid transport system permease subunit